MDKFLLFMCFHYDPERGSYAASAKKLMTLGGAVTLMLMAAGIGVLWFRGSQFERLDSPSTGRPNE